MAFKKPIPQVSDLTDFPPDEQMPMRGAKQSMNPGIVDKAQIMAALMKGKKGRKIKK